MKTEIINELLKELCLISFRKSFPLTVQVSSLSVLVSDAHRDLLAQWLEDNKEKMLVAVSVADELTILDMFRLCSLSLPDAVQCLTEIGAKDKISHVISQAYSLAFDSHLLLAIELHQFITKHRDEFDPKVFEDPFIIWTPIDLENLEKKNNFKLNIKDLFTNPETE